MNVLIDTDVLLDVALNREPYVQESAQVLRWVEVEGSGVIAWHSLTNCAYLLKGDGRTFLSALLQIVDVAPVTHSAAVQALQLPMRDLEDAFQASATLAVGAEAIITRNIRDFTRSPVKAYTPKKFLKLL